LFFTEPGTFHVIFVATSAASFVFAEKEAVVNNNRSRTHFFPLDNDSRLCNFFFLLLSFAEAATDITAAAPAAVSNNPDPFVGVVGVGVGGCVATVPLSSSSSSSSISMISISMPM